MSIETVVEQGPRFKRTTVIETTVTVTEEKRYLFKPNSYRNALLPPNTQPHADSAGAVAQLERMSRRASDPEPADGSGSGTGTATFVPVADYAKFTATLNIVGFAGPGKATFLWGGQEHPVVPIYLMGAKRSTSPALAKVMAGGFPIPPDWAPTPDGVIGDTHFTAWMPDYVGPTGRTGLYWEGHAMQFIPVEERAALGVNPYHPSGEYVWRCWDGGRINGTDVRPARYADYFGNMGAYKGFNPEHFDSAYQEKNWGAVAAGNPLGDGLVTVEDARRGVIDHAIDLITTNSAPGYTWPANRGDGTWSGTLFKTGARFRLPADWVPQGPNAFVRMLEANARDYGWKVGDKTGNCNKVRLEPGVQATPIFAAEGLNAATAIKGFPWGHLQMLAVGSDSNPNPVV